MKRSLGILGVVLVGAVGMAGCGKGPTDPGDGGGAPAPLNLSGTWSGTVTDRSGTCQPEPFTVVLSQGETGDYFGGRSADVSGDFSTPCQGSFAIRGSLVGGSLFGRIADKGRITGNATTSSVQITVMGGSGGLEGGQFVVCVLELRK